MVTGCLGRAEIASSSCWLRPTPAAAFGSDFNYYVVNRQAAAKPDASRSGIGILGSASCNGSDPIHWLAQHVSEVLILELRFKLYGARGSAQVANAASRDKLFLAAVAVLDIPRRLEAEPMAVHWSWLLKAYMQFLPLRFVLDELCYRPRSEVSDHAWTIANMALDRWQEGRVSKANFDICHYLHKQAETARSLSDVDIALPWSICYSSDDFVDATQLMDAVDCCSAIEPLYQR